MSMKGNDWMIKQMEMEHIHILMGQNTQDNEEMINSMAKGWKYGRMERNMKGNIGMESNQAMES